jgi:signal transduction histidine kinase
MSALPIIDSVPSEELQWTAGELALPTPTFPVTTTCAQVFEWFSTNANQVAAAVVDSDNCVVAIANRLRFLARYSQPYVPEIYGKRPITKLANSNPLVVDENVTVAELGALLTVDFPDALRECFVVTRKGRYFGIGTSEALVKSKVELLLLRETQLRLAASRANAASQAKGNFLALMSHELRTPLNAIIGFSEMMSTELLGPLGSKRYSDYANTIHEAGRHLLALINDILDLSKAEAGKLEFYPEATDVPALFQDCLKLVTTRAVENGVTITAEFAAGLPQLYADSLRIKQILLNLLSNAIKFTPRGGSVIVRAELASGNGYIISVRDTGIGMAPESIPLACEPFRQLGSPLQRKAEGTGLGLSLVKLLTEQHGGELTIVSALNEGTTVFVRFPPSRTLMVQCAPLVEVSPACRGLRGIPRHRQ